MQDSRSMVSHNSYEGEDPEEGSFINEVEAVPLTDLMKDDFSTLRMKKLIACVLAEFKTQSNNFKLNEEETQIYKANNAPSK
mmetsp:Transcript_35681/g.54606  ORF Transcript_35681/g.54606 Transcript_35681/m.54606 type:complete len:82 (-) Transcript_35681:1648-1893(-)